MHIDTHTHMNSS